MVVVAVWVTMAVVIAWVAVAVMVAAWLVVAVVMAAWVVVDVLVEVVVGVRGAEVSPREMETAIRMAIAMVMAPCLHVDSQGVTG